ncbi:MAG: sulfurtransferase-like selenium metabolism protein YedF [Candidatus Eisenbacteria bacterium]|nr:sulfurtransferase-like selenium metabolism protein YedF [Candidatus Latescibacterota bacterium]MBD3302663.1 sulfurtransferase-like selenium metabolism protein YedF [Candidatus Eisenbacteria bacterium]
MAWEERCMSKANQEVAGNRVVVQFGADTMGHGPAELGRVLIRSFVKTLGTTGRRPWRAVFVNTGIHLTTEGSDLIEDLRKLEADGLELLSCGTCLDYFEKKEKLQAGRASNMQEIVETLTTADLVVRP